MVPTGAQRAPLADSVSASSAAQASDARLYIYFAVRMLFQSKRVLTDFLVETRFD